MPYNPPNFFFMLEMYDFKVRYEVVQKAIMSMEIIGRVMERIYHPFRELALPS